MSICNNNYTTSYKEYSKGKLKKYKNSTVRPTVDAVMSWIERIALGIGTWHGIDGNGIACSRKVEEYLFYDKQCALVDTVECGLALVKLIPLGINIIGEPAGYDMLTANGTKLTPLIPRTAGSVGEIGTDNAIILRDSQFPNRGRIDGVWHWIELYADAQITANQQMINQRAPIIGMTKDKGDENFARVEILDVMTGVSALTVDEKYSGKLTTLNLNSQFNIEGINAMQHEYLSRALNSLGVDSNQAFGKKERLIVDEAESNDESIAMILTDMYKARNDPLKGHPTAEKYGISFELSKPMRISTYAENLIKYTPATLPADYDKESVSMIEEDGRNAD